MGMNIFQNRLSFSVFVLLAIAINATLNFGQIVSASKYLEASLSRTATYMSQYASSFNDKEREIISSITGEPAKKSAAIPTNDMQCMSENIYHEAGNQSYVGKLAVGQVVLNRLKKEGYPRTICGVIYDGSQNVKTSTCQFTWTCSSHNAIDKTSKQWIESKQAATDLLSQPGKMFDITEGATSYHADYVKPSWSKTLRFVAKIDQHLFYSIPN